MTTKKSQGSEAWSRGCKAVANPCFSLSGCSHIHIQGRNTKYIVNSDSKQRACQKKEHIYKEGLNGEYRGKEKHKKDNGV